MRHSQERGQNGRPSTDAALDPQTARAETIRTIFRKQAKMLATLFQKDGMTLVARSLNASLAALKMRDKKTGALMLENVPPEVIAEKCIACHHMGLEPVSEAYLIPFGKSLEIITAPQGLIKLMANAGWRVTARAVREGDEFDHDLGPAGFIRHKKAQGRRESPVTFGYAFAQHVSGGPAIMDVLSWDDIESYRAQSKQADGPMWLNNYEGAVRKTMVHRISEFIPRPAALSAALRQNESGGIEVSDEILAMLRTKPKTEEAVVERTSDSRRAIATRYTEPGDDEQVIPDLELGARHG